MKPKDWSFLGLLTYKELLALRYCVKLEIINQRRKQRNPDTSIPGKYRTHCPKGHPYDGENLYVNPRGERQCRKCNAIRSEKYRKRKTRSGSF